MNKQVLNFRIEPELYEALQAHAQATERTPSQLARLAIREYLTRNRIVLYPTSTFDTERHREMMDGATP